MIAREIGTVEKGIGKPYVSEEKKKRASRRRPKYPLDHHGRKDLKARITYPPLKGDQGRRFEDIRSRTLSLARKIMEETPKSREQTWALMKLEEAVFWTNAAIANE